MSDKKDSNSTLGKKTAARKTAVVSRKSTKGKNAQPPLKEAAVKNKNAPEKKSHRPGMFLPGNEWAGKSPGRTPKIGSVLRALDNAIKGKITNPDGSEEDIPGGDTAVKMLIDEALGKKSGHADKTLLRQIILMAKQEEREALVEQSMEQTLKERKLAAAASKYELENEIRKKRAEQRAKKEDAETAIKNNKAMQEEIKTQEMMKRYIAVDLMRYYFSFFQRGIDDSFAGVKKISPDIKRLYAAGKDKEAEKVLQLELKVCFENAIKGLEEEIKHDNSNSGK